MFNNIHLRASLFVSMSATARCTLQPSNSGCQNVTSRTTVTQWLSFTIICSEKFCWTNARQQSSSTTQATGGRCAGAHLCAQLRYLQRFDDGRTPALTPTSSACTSAGRRSGPGSENTLFHSKCSKNSLKKQQYTFINTLL